MRGVEAASEVPDLLFPFPALKLPFIGLSYIFEALGGGKGGKGERHSDAKLMRGGGRFT